MRESLVTRFSDLTCNSVTVSDRERYYEFFALSASIDIPSISGAPLIRAIIPSPLEKISFITSSVGLIIYLSCCAPFIADEIKAPSRCMPTSLEMLFFLQTFLSVSNNYTNRQEHRLPL